MVHPMDDTGLVEPVDGLGERVVIAVADAANRGLDAGFPKPPGLANGDVLAATIAVMDQASRCSGRRSCSACSSASSTNPACAVRHTRQSTRRRA